MAVAQQAAWAPHETVIEVLDESLAAVEQTLAGLSDEEWRRPTLLEPFDPADPHWDVLSLVSHIDISIGLTLGLLADRQAGQIGRDRVSFFIADRGQVAPVVYQYALDKARGHTPATMVEQIRETFRKTLDGARSTPPETVGSGYFALMRLDDFVASRIVEGVVHGMDLTDALGRPPLDTPRAIEITAAILDELLARRTVPGRPADLRDDDLAFIRAAAGRGAHPDPRLPLIV